MCIVKPKNICSICTQKILGLANYCIRKKNKEYPETNWLNRTHRFYIKITRVVHYHSGYVDQNE